MMIPLKMRQSSSIISIAPRVTCLWLPLGVLGGADPQVVRDFAFATGLSNWFQAVPQLLAQRRHPLAGAVFQIATQACRTGFAAACNGPQ